MISRVAESCFWLGRFVERAETYSRLLDVTVALQLDGSLSETDQWRSLIIVCGEEKPFVQRHGAEAISQAEPVLEYMTWSQDNPTSIYSSVKWARENVRTIRETASLEMWETINDLWLWIGSRAARRLYDQDRHRFFLDVRDRCMLFDGVRYGTMLHEEPFDFMRLGTALERVSQTARILDVKYHSVGPDRGMEGPVESAQWLAALRSCSAVEPFFMRPANELEGADVAAFLLFDPAFPRSIRYNLEHSALRLAAIRAPASTDIGRASAQGLDEMVERFRATTIEAVLAAGMHEILTWVVDSTSELCRTLEADFFYPPAEIVQTRAAG